ncbi:MAG TPA: hypothetical protein VNI84_05430 [Pyrinomonadaceae bacterium]|nr:hypothetical protein [Pyrinomonadaceae bacterium]
MTELMKRKAEDVVQNNLVYLDEVVEAAIVNLMEDAGVDCDNEFITELQRIYETYVGGEKYGRQTV